MVLCRCLESHSWPQGKKYQYAGYLKPIGYPLTSSICGRSDCGNPGVIWITKDEEEQYELGERIFDGNNAFTKIKVDDSGVHK